MKKILLISSLILIAQSANAFVDNQYMITEQYLVNTGYSSDMANAAKISNQNPYREPYVESKNPKTFFKRLSHYLFLTENMNLDVYNHNGNFNNTSWKDY